MATFTININAEPSAPAGVFISSISKIYGKVTFVLDGAVAGDDITLGITTYNTNTDGSNFYIASILGLSFSPADTYVQKTTNTIYSASGPDSHEILFSDNPDTGAVMIEVRILSSTGIVATGYKQYAYIPYDYYP